MSQKKITKKDPKKQISGWVDYHSQFDNNENIKVSGSLKKLHAERRHALLTRLGLIIFVSVCMILFLSYLISPKADIASVKVAGATELNGKELVDTAGISTKDKVLNTLLKNKHYNNRISAKYPEVKSTSIHVNNVNNIVLNIKEKKVIGYIQNGNSYQKILENGKVGLQPISYEKIAKNKPLFIGYNKKVSLLENIKIYSDFPKNIQNQVKIMSGKNERASQIVLIMKDNNVVVGNTDTISKKINYYENIKNQLKSPAVIDLEIGAFSRPFNGNEKANFEIKE